MGAQPPEGERSARVEDVVGAMHEVAHIFPAVDHRSRLPARPTDAELDRIASSLRTTASAELRDAFERWRRRDEEFLDAVRRL